MQSAACVHGMHAQQYVDALQCTTNFVMTRTGERP